MSHSQKQASQAVSKESLALGHEATDATAKSILWFTIYLTITLAVTIVISMALFWTFTQTEDQAIQQEYVTSPLYQGRPPSPAPPLQPSIGHETLPPQDTAAYLAEYDRLARTSGNDVMADHVSHDRIPVQTAMELLAQAGVPGGTATDIPAPQGPAVSGSTPYSDGGRGSKTGTGAAPGIPQQ
jgi:hypothetical protein